MYQGFTYHHQELSAFAVTLDTFVISLKSGNIVHHVPDHHDNFLSWLRAGNVREIARKTSQLVN